MSESDRLLGALKESYGYDSFRPQQRETIEITIPARLDYFDAQGFDVGTP